MRRDRRSSDRTPSAEFSPRTPSTPREDINHLQNTTPEWQFSLVPSPSSFHTLPAEQAVEGFVHRYPRLREYQSLNAILVQCFSGNEGGIEDFSYQPTTRTCPMLGAKKNRRHEALAVPPEPPTMPVQDHFYHVKFLDQVPGHYSFRRKNRGRNYSGQKSLKDVYGDELSNGRYSGEKSTKTAMTASKTSNPSGTSSGDNNLQQLSATIPKFPNITKPLTPRKCADDYSRHFTEQNSCSKWSELTELIGPLPWPLVNINTDPFSSQPEFRPFLEPRSDEVS